jgi:hypothetical protein
MKGYFALFGVIVLILNVVLSIAGCNSDKNEFSVEKYFDRVSRDTLLVNMVTYIGVKPRFADFQSRHNPQHRKFYTSQARNFRFQYYHVTPDSIHYYYLIRPARSTKGNLRGVGGRFRINQKLELVEFEEIFNTPVLPEVTLESRGRTLFVEMVDKGNVDRFLGNIEYVEWPDDRLKYDREKKEWRFDVTD